MTAAAADFQKALFEALNGDAALVAALGGAKVLDHAPANVAFPYITFGRTSVYDWSTSTESGTEQLFTLHVWSKARVKVEALAVMEIVRRRLDAGALALDGRHLVNLTFEFAEARFDEDLSVYHGLLRYRAVMEDA